MRFARWQCMPSLREAAFPFLVLFAVGCSSAPDPQNVPAAPEAGVTNGVSNQVSVALASTHLGAEGCTHDESGGLKVMACASQPDGSLANGFLRRALREFQCAAVLCLR